MTVKGAPGLLPAVAERAARQRRKGKRYNLPAAADMPPVEVVKIDGSRANGDRQLQFAVAGASRAFAWLHVSVALDALLGDPVVQANPVTVEFLQVVRELASAAVLADSTEEALGPVDGLLPEGRIGVKSRDAHRKSARAPRKIDEGTRREIGRCYESLVRNGERYGAIKALARRFGVARSTISAIVSAKEK